jgi:lipopolysaccharide/colanic/teichoic acid biosynthesis glycosyltransferase
MSLVGPRPSLPRVVTRYKAWHLRRLKVKPGITCLWQIGGRGDINFEGQVRLDLQYIASQSLWGDIVILIKTIPAVLAGKGAY